MTIPSIGTPVGCKDILSGFFSTRAREKFATTIANQTKRKHVLLTNSGTAAYFLILKSLQRLSGKTIVGFGASARSSTYLNFCGITNTEIKAIIDNNRLKHGFYSPGSSIPIVSVEEGFRMRPDLLFILAWNFKDEIVKECQKRGYKGDYLIPFPNTPYILRTKALEGII